MASTNLDLGPLEAPAFLLHGAPFHNQLRGMDELEDGKSGEDLQDTSRTMFYLSWFAMNKVRYQCHDILR